MNLNTLTASPDSAQTGLSSANCGEYLSFRIGGEEYGIDILRVQEIRGYGAPTRMVNSLPVIKGVINLRGVIVPIFDLRIKFGLREVSYDDDKAVTIVLNIGQRVVGVVVDSVSDVIDLQSADITPAPAFGGATSADYITGLGSIQHGGEDRMLILMDIEKLMFSADMGLISQSFQVQ